MLIRKQELITLIKDKYYRNTNFNYSKPSNIGQSAVSGSSNK